jgi:two-component system, sensor histidine kinase and response regulator
LTSVLFASDILVNNGTRPERIPRYLEMIHDSALDALGYIRRYLEAQADHVHSREVADAANATASLPDVLDWLSHRYGLQLESRGMQLLVHAPAQCNPVAIDGLVLRQVAENLLSNAMKYAPGGNIEISIRGSSPGFWQLVVEDLGPGIPPGKQRELFKPFTRLSEVDPANGRSNGLGLSLARQIVANAGGQLWYEDRDGGGARFVIELPEAITPGG